MLFSSMRSLLFTRSASNGSGVVLFAFVLCNVGLTAAARLTTMISFTLLEFAKHFLTANILHANFRSQASRTFSKGAITSLPMAGLPLPQRAAVYTRLLQGSSPRRVREDFRAPRATERTPLLGTQWDNDPPADIMLSRVLVCALPFNIRYTDLT